MSVRALFCLFKAIAIAVYKTVITTKGVIKSKASCTNEIAADTSGLSLVLLQNAFLLLRTTTSAIINDGELKKPANIQVEAMAAVRILGEMRPSFIGKRQQQIYQLLSTPSFELKHGGLQRSKWNNLQKIDPNIPLTYQCHDSFAKPITLTGITIRGKIRSDTAIFTMK